ncbi:hypothetical protein HK100_012651, partial [Physocladia obscura]
MAPTETEFIKDQIPVPNITPKDLHLPPCMITIEGHSAAVYAVAINQDGQFVVSGSYDKTVKKIWDTQTGALQRTLEGHSSVVNKVAISADGQFVVSGSDEMTVKFSDAQTGAPVKNSVANGKFPPNDGQYKFSYAVGVDSECIVFKNFWLCGVGCEVLFYQTSSVKVQGK